ncbi:MAG: PqqD family protein [Acidobacteriota bacterium]|nr:PqqD family protein [Acidobacteriota bacterium]
MYPHARIDGLEVTERESGLHVYDRTREEVYHLHPLTAFVWKQADGRTSVADLAARAAEDLGTPVDEAMIWSALDKLSEAGLLRARLAPPSAPKQVNRRALMRRVAVGSVAAAALGFLGDRRAEAAPHGNDNDSKEDVDKKLHELEQDVEQAKKAHEEAEAKRRQAAQEQRVKHEDNRRHPGGTPIALSADWYSAGAPYQFAAFRRTADTVVITGLVRPVPNAGSLIGTLPPHVRPAGTVIYLQYAQFGGTDQTLRVDVQADGQIVLGNGTPDPSGWLSLSGIVFVPYQGHNPNPLNDGDGDTDDGPTQEQQSKITQEQTDKEQASKEQQQKQAAEQQEKAKEQDAKQQAEQQQKAQEQATKQQAEQQQKQQEQAAKQSVEQQQKQAAEQQQKQAAEQQQKQAAEQQQKQAAEQQQKQAAEQSAKEVTTKHQEESAKEAQAKQQAAEQQQKRQAEQAAKGGF